MKKVLKGKHFVDVEKVKTKTTEALKRHHFARVLGLLRKVENTFRQVNCIKWTVL
jgi:GTP1/Obg family GTP-binding protein